MGWTSLKKTYFSSLSIEQAFEMGLWVVGLLKTDQQYNWITFIVMLN